MKIPIVLKLKLINKVINPLALLNDFKNGYFNVKTKNGLLFRARGKTADLAEIIVVSSGFEYPIDKIELCHNPIIVDLGAHIGTFSVNICNTFVKNNPKIYSYEPFDQNYQLLNENIKINGFDKNIKTFKNAIGTENKIVYLENIKNFDAITISNNKTGYGVEQISLIEIFRDLGHVDLIKIDIEGEEANIINKYYKEISEYCDNILLEIHYDKNISKKLEMLLSSVGFKLVYSKDIGSHVIYMKR